jgi:hypothetical protein
MKIAGMHMSEYEQARLQQRESTPASQAAPSGALAGHPAEQHMTMYDEFAGDVIVDHNEHYSLLIWKRFALCLARSMMGTGALTTARSRQQGCHCCPTSPCKKRATASVYIEA